MVCGKPPLKYGGKAQAGIPYGAQAGLTVAFIALIDQHIFYGLYSPNNIRVVFRISQNLQRHHRIGHGGKNGPDTPLSPHPLTGPGFGQLKPFFSQHPGHQGINFFQETIQKQKAVLKKTARDKTIQVLKLVSGGYKKL